MMRRNKGMAVTARILAVSLVILCSAAGTASACQKHTAPMFQDDFKNADPGWGQADNVAAFTPQGLVLTPPVSGSAWRTNANVSMAQGDWCVEVISPASLPTPADEDAVGSVGVSFLGSDLQNFYTATITLDGNASVDRLNHGIWQAVVTPTPAPSIKTSPGATNEIEIVTNGNKAAFYVNDTLVTNITGQPPANGGPAGIYGESGPKGTSWVFPRVALY
jgi:hypothetical protein